MTLRVILFSLCLGLLAGCASTPVPDVRRTAPAATGEVVPGAAQTAAMKEDEAPVTGPQAQIRRGNGQMINRSAASLVTAQAERRAVGYSVALLSIGAALGAAIVYVAYLVGR